MRRAEDGTGIEEAVNTYVLQMAGKGKPEVLGACSVFKKYGEQLGLVGTWWSGQEKRVLSGEVSGAAAPGAPVQMKPRPTSSLTCGWA